MAAWGCSVVVMLATLPLRLPAGSPLSWAQALIPFCLMLTCFGYSIFYLFLPLRLPFLKRGGARNEEYAGQALEMELREIAEQAGSRAIGPLIDILRVNPPSVGIAAVYIPLIFLLSKVQDTDANCVTPAQREYLYRSLKPIQDQRYISGWNDDFRVAILKALEHIGDSRAIPIVEELANAESNGFGERKVRDAARECQLRLWQHSGQVDAAKTLLRAASSPAAPEKSLLRPAFGKPETAPQELLRPTDSNPPQSPLS